ncbi:MAG: polyprenyl synthetase family protein [Candidatus Coatesbacteria bacterium]|nr:polyprenyl synthetase family protein [Candidatus Coatesbacteria bacterium]
MDFDARLANCQSIVDIALRRPRRAAAADCASCAPDCLAVATEYALDGGKRLRPYVVFAVAELLRRDPLDFIEAACSVECIHTSSLILDDLPCMDNSDTRRGKPSLHSEFGEAMAILTAVSLLSRGFEHLAKNAADLGLSSKATGRALKCLAHKVGENGMASGQMAELLSGAPTDLRSMELVNDRKTGLLFVASAEIPAILAGATEADIEAVGRYAHELGQAYQITDDILDLPTKKAASDHPDSGPKHEKRTIATLLGPEKAAQKAHAHIDAALDVIKTYGAPAEALRLLCDYVLGRVK